jgi:glycosyltransferase involved in cell wall biosynthesis
MKRALIINAVCGNGSTGRITAKIASEYEANGWEVRLVYGRDAYVPEHCRKWAVRIGNGISVKLHGILTRLFDWHGTGLCSRLATKRFLKWAEAWGPDEVWLHNLHGYYINYELLFAWIKRHPEMKVKWTLHDCWAFTGHCSHFLLTDCGRWQSGCFGCPEKREYPATLGLSAAKANWKKKRRAFCGVKNMRLITPSNWLADLTRQSFLKEYPVEVVHNTIDLSVFKPTPSDFRERMGLNGKIIILGVASVWDRRKGLVDFLALQKLLNSGEKGQASFPKNDKVEHSYVIILVGLTERQISSLTPGVIGIARTNSTTELAEIYSAADWFFNPTHEDSYPTVNLEARACGCKIATYDTGGAAETVEGYDKAWVLKGEDKCPEGFVRLLSKEMEAK